MISQLRGPPIQRASASNLFRGVARRIGSSASSHPQSVYPILLPRVYARCPLMSDFSGFPAGKGGHARQQGQSAPPQAHHQFHTPVPVPSNRSRSHLLSRPMSMGGALRSMGPPPLPGTSQGSRFARPSTAGAVLSSFQKISTVSADRHAARRLFEGSGVSSAPFSHARRFTPQAAAQQTKFVRSEKELARLNSEPSRSQIVPNLTQEQQPLAENDESEGICSDRDDESDTVRSKDVGDALRTILKNLADLESFPDRIDQRMAEMQQLVTAKVRNQGNSVIGRSLMSARWVLTPLNCCCASSISGLRDRRLDIEEQGE
jgi:hypothetical protein